MWQDVSDIVSITVARQSGSFFPRTFQLAILMACSSMEKTKQTQIWQMECEHQAICICYMPGLSAAGTATSSAPVSSLAVVVSS